MKKCQQIKKAHCEIGIGILFLHTVICTSTHFLVIFIHDLLTQTAGINWDQLCDPNLFVVTDYSPDPEQKF